MFSTSLIALNKFILYILKLLYFKNDICLSLKSKYIFGLQLFLPQKEIAGKFANIIEIYRIKYNGLKVLLTELPPLRFSLGYSGFGHKSPGAGLETKISGFKKIKIQKTSGKAPRNWIKIANFFLMYAIYI